MNDIASMRKMRPLPLSGGSFAGRETGSLLSGAAVSAGLGDFVRAGKTTRFYQSDTLAESMTQRGFPPV
jgi:hypothetical protein